MRTSGAFNRKKAVRLLLPAAIPLLLTVIFLLLSARRGFAAFVAQYIGGPIRSALGYLCSACPSSVMEALYGAAAVLFVLWLVRSVILTIRAKRRVRTLLRRVLILVTVVLWLVAGFLYLWGANYRAPTFSEKSGLISDGCTPSELFEVSLYFAERASSLSQSVPRGEDGVMNAPVETIADGWRAAYSSLPEEFPCLTGRLNRPKQMMFSRLMSAIGFTGIYFPFTGETNLNVDMPRCLLPFTVAHELAHQLGYAAEQECNFLGAAACVTSGDAVYEYSGYLAGLLYVSNALYSADPAAWYAVMGTCDVGVLLDLQANFDYWAAWASPVEEAAESVYDGYLKTQGQPLGIRSYGACVDLLVEYFLPISRAA
ncbi:MAG: DUF3810 domain-containing protein [Oscillospiraceae bacterium]|nr:DUF3810 domain-containing protein [Oscillospiraceae bacterium]